MDQVRYRSFAHGPDEPSLPINLGSAYEIEVKTVPLPKLAEVTSRICIHHWRPSRAVIITVAGGYSGCMHKQLCPGDRHQHLLARTSSTQLTPR